MIPELFEMDFYEEAAWNVALRPDESLTVPIIRKGDRAYLGQVVLKQIDHRAIEIGLDLKRAHQNQGIGTAVMTLLLSEIHRKYPEEVVIARVYSDNTRSIHLIKKVGGVKLSEMPTEYETVKAEMEQLMEEAGIEVQKLPAEDREKHIDIFRL